MTTVNGYTVVDVRTNLFNDMDNKENLISVTLPSGMTSIEKDMLERFTNLETVVLPNSIEEICDAAFYGCSSLSAINIPTNLERIGVVAFYGCTSLWGAHYDTNGDEVPHYLYSLDVEKNLIIKTPNTMALGAAEKYLVIPSSTETIGEYAFANCTFICFLSNAGFTTSKIFSSILSLSINIFIFLYVSSSQRPIL